MKDKDLPEKLLISGFMCFLIMFMTYQGVNLLSFTTTIFMQEIEPVPFEEMEQFCVNLYDVHMGSYFADRCLDDPLVFAYDVKNAFGSIFLAGSALLISLAVLIPYLFKRGMCIKFSQLFSTKYDLEKALKCADK